jgi:hypothetical protein
MISGPLKARGGKFPRRKRVRRHDILYSRYEYGLNDANYRRKANLLHELLRFVMGWLMFRPVADTFCIIVINCNDLKLE